MPDISSRAIARIKQIATALGDLHNLLNDLVDDLSVADASPAVSKTSQPSLPLVSPTRAKEKRPPAAREVDEDSSPLRMRILRLFDVLDEVRRKDIDARWPDEAHESLATLNELIEEGLVERLGWARSTRYVRGDAEAALVETPADEKDVARPSAPPTTAPEGLRARIISLFEEVEQINRQQVLARWPEDASRVLPTLKELMAEGVIERRGRTRGTHYVRLAGDTASEPVVMRKPPARLRVTPIDPVIKDALDELLGQIDREHTHIADAGREACTARLATWAGRARQIQQEALDADHDSPALQREFRRLFGRLTRTAKKTKNSDWIHGIDRDFHCDWGDYVLYQQRRLAEAMGVAPPEETIDPERLKDLHRAMLGALLANQYRADNAQTRRFLIEALPILGHTDSAIQQVVARFPATHSVLKAGAKVRKKKK